MRTRKVGIVGVGHVGAHVAFSLATQGLVGELSLVDIIADKAVSERQDLIDAMQFLPHNVKVNVATYEELHDCDIVVISVGKIVPGDRRAETKNSIKIVDDTIPKIVKGGFNGIFIVITNPCDIIARRVWQLSGFAKNKVFGTGTCLDTSRLKSVLSLKTGIAPESIGGYMLGEHGETQFVAWSHVNFGSILFSALEQNEPEIFGNWDKDALAETVRRAGYVTLKGKGATEFAIASVLARLVRCIFFDERQIFPVSACLDRLYEEGDLFIGNPCVIGKNGVEKVIKMHLPQEEYSLLKNSCNEVRNTIKIFE